MKSTMTLQVDTDTLLRLITQLKLRGGTQDVSAVVNDAIELWMQEQSKLNKRCNPASVRGYQWKTLFLPEGTQLRSWSYGDHNYASVIGDEIIHQGQSVSPNEFAQSFARTTRNAWTDLSVRRPEDQHFIPADRFRRELAQQAKAQAHVPGAAATLADTSVGALLTALQAQVKASLPPPRVEPAPRNVTPGAGWDLPERRKFRYRLEDVAFE